jgi:hypothetical protein
MRVDYLRFDAAAMAERGSERDLTEAAAGSTETVFRANAARTTVLEANSSF